MGCTKLCQGATKKVENRVQATSSALLEANLTESENQTELCQKP